MSSNASVTIRPMTGEDLNPVRIIDELSFPIPWPANSYRFELYENPSSLLRVAEASLPDGSRRIVGMIVIWLIMDEAHVASIAVHPDYRGQGLGRRLLAEGLYDSIQRGATQSTLEVREGNVVAQTMYREFGYDVVNRRRHYYVDNNEDALTMARYGMDHDYQEWLAVCRLPATEEEGMSREDGA